MNGRMYPQPRCRVLGFAGFLGNPRARLEKR